MIFLFGSQWMQHKKEIFIAAFGFSMAPESVQMNGHFYLLKTEL